MTTSMKFRQTDKHKHSLEVAEVRMPLLEKGWPVLLLLCHLSSCSVHCSAWKAPVVWRDFFKISIKIRVMTSRLHMCRCKVVLETPWV